MLVVVVVDVAEVVEAESGCEDVVDHVRVQVEHVQVVEVVEPLVLHCLGAHVQQVQDVLAFVLQLFFFQFLRDLYFSFIIIFYIIEFTLI